MKWNSMNLRKFTRPFKTRKKLLLYSYFFKFCLPILLNISLQFKRMVSIQKIPIGNEKISNINYF